MRGDEKVWNSMRKCEEVRKTIKEEYEEVSISMKKYVNV